MGHAAAPVRATGTSAAPASSNVDSVLMWLDAVWRLLGGSGPAPAARGLNAVLAYVHLIHRQLLTIHNAPGAVAGNPLPLVQAANQLDLYNRIRNSVYAVLSEIAKKPDRAGAGASGPLPPLSTTIDPTDETVAILAQIVKELRRKAPFPKITGIVLPANPSVTTADPSGASVVFLLEDIVQQLN